MLNKIRKIRQKHQKMITNTDFKGNEVIYHYTNPEAFLAIIQNSKFRFSDVSCLNDESERFYTYQLLKRVLDADPNLINQEFYKLIMEKVESFLNKDKPKGLFEYIRRSSYFVASFSTDNDNLSLWNYYTKTPDMFGYNIGFSKNIIHKLSKEIGLTAPFFTFGEIIYEEEIQKQMIISALKDYNELFEETSNEAPQNFRDSFLGLIIAFSLFFKQNCFSAEKEYRIVIDQRIDPLMKEERKYKICHREKKGLIIPYIECEITLEDILSVHISPTTKNEYFKESTERFLISSNYTRARVFNSKIPLRY